jgi:ABC-type uncharacterized transport system permease subunit
MITVAHFIAMSAYLGAAALAATPIARPVSAPVRGVIAMLAVGVAAHIAGLVSFALRAGQMPLVGLGPALSFAGLALAVSLLIVEVLAREVSLTLIAAPLAALPTATANLLGLQATGEPLGVRGAWLGAHIALSFCGIAAFATAAAAGVMYLVERRELRSRRFGAIFRFFPPLQTLDRVNHVAGITGWVALTVGVVLAFSYSLAYRQLDVPQLIWGTATWMGVTAVAVGRVVAGWQARRAALVSSVTFVAVIALYVALRVAGSAGGKFL